MDPKQLRIIFMGTPGFAVESLKALVENHYQVVAVITAPDKPAGRGQNLSEPAVKVYAREKQIPVLQPEKLKNPEFLETLKGFRADLQIVVAFRMLPEVVWDMPPLGTFNLHGSILPNYRGAAPLNWAVINGEKETGVTTFQLSHEIDTGKVLFMERTLIGEDETVGDIHDRLMVTGARLVLKTVDALAGGAVDPVPQEKLMDGTAELKPAPKMFRDDLRIPWDKPAKEVWNFIRGLSPYPAAWTTFVNLISGKSTEVRIFLARPVQGEYAPSGTIKSDGKTILEAACGEGWLSVTDLQISGRKRMKVEEFLRGFQKPQDYRLE